MTIEMINVPVNRLDDKTYTHHLIPHIIKELNKEKSPIIVITDKELFAHGLIAASKNIKGDTIHYNELNKLPINILSGSLTETLYLFDNLGLLNKLLPYTTTEAFFFQMSQLVMRNALLVVKRLYEDRATLSSLNNLLNNRCGQGRKMVNEFQRLPTQSLEDANEQEYVSLWFLTDYFTGLDGGRGATKTYDYSSSVRTNLMNFTDEWSTIAEVNNYEASIPSDVRLITINLSTLKSNKSNIVKYLIHKLSQSIPNSFIYVDISNTDSIEWESVLLNNRGISKITQICSFSKNSDRNYHCSTKRIQSFRGHKRIKSSEIEKQIMSYYENLNSAKQSYNEDMSMTEELPVTIGVSDFNLISSDFGNDLLSDEREALVLSDTLHELKPNGINKKEEPLETDDKNDDFLLLEPDIFIGEIDLSCDFEDL